jgi:hypothetical protein
VEDSVGGASDGVSLEDGVSLGAIDSLTDSVGVSEIEGVGEEERLSVGDSEIVAESVRGSV